MIGELPKSLEIQGRKYRIRTHFQDVLKIISAFNDPEFEDKDKMYICLTILFIDFESMSPDLYEDAFKAAIKFIDCGAEGNDKKQLHIMDWEQDENIMFPAINKVAGFETRRVKYLHWWTFIGYYMEISEGVFSTVLSLRAKKAKHKKLEKYEREYWNANKDICVIKPRLSAEEQAAKERLKALLD
ncbi:MAG: bacteriophage Gp15 family protein [Ruminococcus flavefaciens]|nr:bacteriophage Gp15 family protein [Ruminococcus flavefaciens]